MSEELNKFVPLLSDNSKKKQKHNKDHKKKIEYVDREVLNITGGLFPMMPASNTQ